MGDSPIRTTTILIMTVDVSVISARQILDTAERINRRKLNNPACSSYMVSLHSWFKWYLGLPFLTGELRVSVHTAEAEDFYLNEQWVVITTTIVIIIIINFTCNNVDILKSQSSYNKRQKQKAEKYQERIIIKKKKQVQNEIQASRKWLWWRQTQKFLNISENFKRKWPWLLN